MSTNIYCTKTELMFNNELNSMEIDYDDIQNNLDTISVNSRNDTTNLTQKDSEFKNNKIIELDTNFIVHKTNKKDSVPFFTTVPEGYRIPTATERWCITESQANERKLMIKCNTCEGEKYYNLSIETTGYQKCSESHKHSDTTEIYYSFSSQCRNCRRAGCKRSRQSQKLQNPNSLHDQNLKRNRKVQLLMQTDKNFLIKERIRGQRKNHCKKIQLNKILHDWYKQHKVEYGQCVICLQINPLLIEFDHDESLMQNGEQKINTVCKIATVKNKAKEVEKTRPLCKMCHSKKTHTDRISPSYHGLYGKSREGFKMVQERKLIGCQCCGIQNPSPELGIYFWFFHIDHIDNNQKSEWFKEKGSFRSNVNYPSLDLLQEELDKCQILCANCHHLKTYVEHPETHSLTKHNFLRQYNSQFIDWYKDTYKNDSQLLNHLESQRSKTDEFVPIITDTPYKSKQNTSKIE